MVDEIYKNGGKIIKNQSHNLEAEMNQKAKKIKPGNANNQF